MEANCRKCWDGRFVPLADANVVEDWISSSTTTFTDIDVSDDGVRKGSVAVECSSYFISSAGAPTLYVRRNGSSVDTTANSVAAIMSTSLLVDVFTAKLDNDGKFEAKFSASWTSVSNALYVLGYYI